MKTLNYIGKDSLKKIVGLKLKKNIIVEHTRLLSNMKRF